MKIISFATLKGGVGKTTLTFNIAGLLASKGYHILLIDNDAQANLTSNCGLDDSQENFKSIADIYENNIDINEVIHKTSIENIDIIPSSIDLTRSEIRLVNESARELILKKYFKKNKKVFEKYDYILIDTSPSMSIVNQNCFMICDSIVLATDIGMNGLKGIQLFTALWEQICDRFEIKNNIKAIVINQFRKNLKMHKEFQEYMEDEEEIKDILCKTIIPLSVKISECELENTTINTYNEKTSVGLAINALMQELFERRVL